MSTIPIELSYMWNQLCNKNNFPIRSNFWFEQKHRISYSWAPGNNFDPEFHCAFCSEIIVRSAFVALNNKKYWKWQTHRRAFRIVFKICLLSDTVFFLEIFNCGCNTFSDVFFIWFWWIWQIQSNWVGTLMYGKSGDWNAKGGKIIMKQRAQTNNTRFRLTANWCVVCCLARCPFFYFANVILYSIVFLLILYSMKCTKIKKLFAKSKSTK